jgi:hypothetical protein
VAAVKLDSRGIEAEQSMAGCKAAEAYVGLMSGNAQYRVVLRM